MIASNDLNSSTISAVSIEREGNSGKRIALYLVTTSTDSLSSTLQTTTSLPSCDVLVETSTIEPTSMASSISSTQSTASTNHFDCSAPRITLIPQTSSLSSPLLFRRNQDFYISSHVDLHCSSSLVIDARWIIENCTISCSGPISIDASIATAFTEIYIPSRTLPLGLYRFTLTIHMQVDPQLTASASVYIQLTSAGITANLVPFGTSMITHGHDQDLILDPGRHSIALDGTLLDANVRLFLDRHISML
jgi:hypothetical protein